MCEPGLLGVGPSWEQGIISFSGLQGEKIIRNPRRTVENGIEVRGGLDKTHMGEIKTGAVVTTLTLGH